MTAYVITFLNGKRMFAHAKLRTALQSRTHDGWRPFVWTDRLIDAEKFGSEEGARAFAEAAFPHDDWSVRMVVGVQPGPGGGGRAMAA